MANDLMSEFNDKVYQIVRAIPYGRVMTYGQIAALLGIPRAARAVGWALHSVPSAAKVPCQRVVNRNGGLAGGYGWGGQAAHKADLLPEGVEIRDDFTVDLKKYQWFPADGDVPGLELSPAVREFIDQRLSSSNERLSYPAKKPK